MCFFRKSICVSFFRKCEKLMEANQEYHVVDIYWAKMEVDSKNSYRHIISLSDKVQMNVESRYIYAIIQLDIEFQACINMP